MSGGEKVTAIQEVRLACRQFAMLYFQFCKTLVEAFGEEGALPLAQKTIFRLSLDRTDRIRQKAEEAGLAPTVDNFARLNDLPFAAWQEWTPEMGGLRCPYAETWGQYYEDHPWFKKFASLYCDVIDTTNIENFSRTTSHRITANLIWGDPACEREYFESDAVKNGVFTYGCRGEPAAGGGEP
ncbi:MAG: L-2-amino-thiazoline-4-carboxylic acid hydrolase [Treponema sp.]|jgi:hypothetical protein|nr:L-2-amino-thiazoline-4-carboxylic acid hydrolase [Treponema sp.]